MRQVDSFTKCQSLARELHTDWPGCMQLLSCHEDWDLQRACTAYMITELALLIRLNDPISRGVPAPIHQKLVKVSSWLHR